MNTSHPIIAKKTFKIFYISLVLGLISNFSWIYFSDSQQESALIYFYFIPLLASFSVCGKHCGPTLSSLSAVLSILVFVIQWFILIYANKIIFESIRKMRLKR